MFAGTAYGIALNDGAQLSALDPAFHEKPYGQPPRAPVLYVKSGPGIVRGGAAIAVPQGADGLVLGATIALQRTVTGFGAARLALDLAVPHQSFFRPAIAELGRDGLLAVGDAGVVPAALDDLEIVTTVNGAEVHRWNLSRLHRDVRTAIADVTAYMSLLPGDMLLAGVAGDAPIGRAGDRIEIAANGLAGLTVTLGAAEGGRP
ncbi:fumarylacetoacetate hydrolase family protein [Sphingomonas colocasiae]|uniref:Fumarylacetoacetate hydrolase family protein n=1 Tax=Sphingomonas colocasiae TaxID=1848973 RepID=A0ABS7PRD6_9SPHN|nr:fumarylacetoacetate hydrolase family protein [Sphingomonas colocasiae]MBY8823741.1 fumarylacetoacetate hydrolase family protein [Sphingomonas colocasiae]